MAENNRTPVAIRIVRPYETEDELLANELETVGKTSVILIGAHPRPTGVILRFEVTLASGATILRGEGRVLAHKEQAYRGQPGLSLRFTRLDVKSKALVDRATAIREARTAGEPDPRNSHAPGPEPTDERQGAPASSAENSTSISEVSAIAEALMQTPAPVRARRSTKPSARDEGLDALEPELRSIVIAESASELPPADKPSEPPGEPLRALSAAVAASSSEAASAAKEAFLARLRERAQSLPAERVAAILASRK